MAPYKTRIGHAHLKVRELQRSLDFYTTYFDLKVIEQVGDHFAFLSGGDLHHELALQAVGANAPQAHPYGVGLYHIAFEVPDKAAFAAAFDHLTAGNLRVTAVDHRISWALYFSDPDGNGLEIYVDTRRDHGDDIDWQGITRPLTRTQIEAVRVSS